MALDIEEREVRKKQRVDSCEIKRKKLPKEYIDARFKRLFNDAFKVQSISIN